MNGFSRHGVDIVAPAPMRPVAKLDGITRIDGLEASGRRLSCPQVKVAGAFVLVPAHAAAIGCVRRSAIAQIGLQVGGAPTLSGFMQRACRWDPVRGVAVEADDAELEFVPRAPRATAGDALFARIPSPVFLDLDPVAVGETMERLTAPA